MKFGFCVVFVTCGFLFVNCDDLDYNPSQRDYECPSMCVCDLFMDMNRANCSRQNLIGANIGMSAFVEIFDLSNNAITAIDSQCFDHLIQMTTLSLNDNSIIYIDLDAFVVSRKLHTIDLSRNRLESIDSHIFEQNRHLFNLNLAENMFMTLPNDPLIRSQSLQILDLQKCKMTNLPMRAFDELPNIRSIDLSGNWLIVLHMSPFMQTTKLKLLSVEGNPMRCDASMQMTLDAMRRNRIKVFFEKCPTSGTSVSPGKFERMMILPTTTEAPVTESERPPELTKIWKIHQNETCATNNTMYLCAMYKHCMANLSQCTGQRPTVAESENGFDITSRHSWMRFAKVNLAFYAGLGIGTIFGMLIVCMMSVIVSKYFTPSKNHIHDDSDRRNRSRRRRRSNDRIRSESHHHAREQPLNPINASSQHAEIVRYDASNARRPPTNSFFSLFFERPVRHQYYRQLNRSATNLMRRLSQSRLFLNTTRAENADYRRNYVRTNTQESAASPSQAVEVESVNDDIESEALVDGLIRSTSMPSLNADYEDATCTTLAPGNLRSTASETNILFDRAETPPPPYIEHIPETV